MSQNKYDIIKRLQHDGHITDDEAAILRGNHILGVFSYINWESTSTGDIGWVDDVKYEE